MNGTGSNRHESWLGQTNRHTRDSSRYSDCAVVWAGGSQARDLAEALSDGRAQRSGPNLAASCVESGAALLVLSKRSSFDLSSTATAHGFDRDKTRSIVAAVGGGPHSMLAASIADWLSLRLGVSASAVYGYSDPSDRSKAEEVLRVTLARLPGMDACTIEAPSPAAMVRMLPAGTLLVVGAPEGSWFQQRFFGPGARIRAMASSGNIVVRHSPTRIYQVMQDPIAYGPHMRVSDALKISDGLDVVVAEHGKLIGTVQAQSMMSVRSDLELHQVMDDGQVLAPDDTVDEAVMLTTTRRGILVPVIDAEEHLVGCVSTTDLSKVVIV
jgi:CBS domain-containing protein